MDKNGKVVAIATQKGGVGKSLTTVNLGVCLGARNYDVGVICVDPQGSTIDYADLIANSGNQNFKYYKCDQSNVGYTISQLRRVHDFIIVDCAPRLEKIIAEIIRSADLILSPMRAGTLETFALDDFLKAVVHHQKANFGRPAVRMFLSDAHKIERRANRITQEAVEQKGFKFIDTIWHKVVFTDAQALGKGVVQCDDAKAANNIEKFTTTVEKVINDECRTTTH